MLRMTSPILSVGQCASIACLLEATAPKPGNVHRGADFEDLSYVDFALSAVLIAPHMDAAACGQSVGQTVLDAVRACRSGVGTNSNLGMILLLAPLAKSPPDLPLAEGVKQILAALDADDSRLIYEAIRHAQPGGLGTADLHDVAGPAPARLLDAMQLAADRDLVARQYVNGYEQVLGLAAPAIVGGVAAGWTVADAIVHAYLQLMSVHPDTLIARKCGPALAQQAADRAAEVLRRGNPGEAAYHDALADLDFWLRSDHHRRNPGTSADLVAAALFVLLRERQINLPLRW
jgi:triphosphoribosyl-dephospho-CoA synthase